MREREITVDLKKLQVGDVILFHGMATLSKIIQFFQRNRYSHSGIVSEDEFGNMTLVEAVIQGIDSHLIRNEITNCDIKVIRYNILSPLFDDEKKVLIERINSKIGKPYDFAGLILDQPISTISDVKDPNSGIWLGGKKPDKFECGTFVAWCLGLPRFYEATPALFDTYYSNFFTTLYQGNTYDNVIY